MPTCEAPRDVAHRHPAPAVCGIRRAAAGFRGPLAGNTLSGSRVSGFLSGPGVPGYAELVFLLLHGK